jgi:hypothetical protein
MNQTWLYVFQSIVLIGCSQSSERPEALTNPKTYYPSDKIIVMPAEDSAHVRFEVTGTVAEFNIADISKTTRVKNLHTYLTVKVEETQPANIASSLPIDELKFSWRTNEARDREILVGDKVTVTVVGNNYTDPTWFRLYDLKKINR